MSLDTVDDAGVTSTVIMANSVNGRTESGVHATSALQPSSARKTISVDQSGTTAQGRLLVIIPAFNEELALPLVLERLRRTLVGSDVVVIDDGSTDRTADVAREAGAEVVCLPYNLGIGGALRTGFRYAVTHGYSRAIQFDADGQHDVDQVSTLTRALDNGADLVIGSRFADGGSDYSVGRLRGGAMGLLRWMVRRSTGQRFTDTSSGFRAFSADMLEFFSRTYPAEYMESVEALLRAHRHGYSVVEVPTLMNEREAGVPSNRNVRLIYHFCRLILVVLVADRNPEHDRKLSTETALPGTAGGS